jgi:hypothetical protein
MSVTLLAVSTSERAIFFTIVFNGIEWCPTRLANFLGVLVNHRVDSIGWIGGTIELGLSTLA